ncbi:MAG: hypothetical protein SGBAC_002499 [Bacillariaceae sp.]
MAPRRQSLGFRALISLVIAFGLLNVFYSGYLVSSSEASFSSTWNGLDGFGSATTGVRSGGQRKGQARSQHATAIDASTGIDAPPPLKVKYVGVAGLGHRLIRMSSIYHLSRILQVPEIDVMWRGFCPKQNGAKPPNIFQLLFGNSTLKVPSLHHNDRKVLFPFLSHDTPESLSRALFPNTKEASSKTQKIQEVKIINEVEGYTHAYDNQAIQTVNPPYYGKLMTDFEFYTNLLQNYQFKSDVDQLFASFDKDTTTIIGAHIRAGNGEVGDFEKYRQLGQGNLDEWLSNFCHLLKEVVNDSALTQSKRSTVLFVATDTASVVDSLRQHLGDSIPILVTPQHYPTEGDGVSYNGYHANLSTCLDSWKSQMMDMVGLGEHADILIAGQYSSFTQSLPLSRILNDDNQRQRFFCDVDQSAQALKCYDSSKGGMDSWFASKHVRYVGGAAVDNDAVVNKSNFAGPQIFLPTDLDLPSLKRMIGRGGQKKKQQK